MCRPLTSLWTALWILISIYNYVMKSRSVWCICWWFMASPSQLLLNCSTCVLVADSVAVADGWMTASVTRSPSSCVFRRLSMHIIPSLLRLLVSSAFNHLAVCASVCVFSLGLSQHLFFFFFFTASQRFLPLLPSALLSCSTATCGRCWEEREKKKATVMRGKKYTDTKAPSPELACSCTGKKKEKNINYLHDWMMLAQLWGCRLCWDEWFCTARRRFPSRLVFVLRIPPRHQ